MTAVRPLLFTLLLTCPSFAQDFQQQNTPANLQSLCQQIQKAIAAGDTKKTAQLARALMPDETRIKKALRDDVAAEALAPIVALHRKHAQGADADFAKIFSVKPDQTQVRVHSATTEEIARYTQGSVPFQHFPSATQKLAQTILRPGTTFHEVEFLKPGERAGMKYHLFFWDGAQWSMLGPIWRTVR